MMLSIADRHATKLLEMTLKQKVPLSEWSQSSSSSTQSVLQYFIFFICQHQQNATTQNLKNMTKLVTDSVKKINQLLTVTNLSVKHNYH